MLLTQERLRSVKQASSRTIQTSGASRFVRGAHHRRCARVGLTKRYDALAGPKLQVGERGSICRVQDIF